MQLKTYQQQALDQLERWLGVLKEARLNGEKARGVLEGQRGEGVSNAMDGALGGGGGVVFCGVLRTMGGG